MTPQRPLYDLTNYSNAGSTRKKWIAFVIGLAIGGVLLSILRH